MSPFLACGDFHARSRFARSTILEEKWGTTRSLDAGPLVNFLEIGVGYLVWVPIFFIKEPFGL